MRVKSPLSSPLSAPLRALYEVGAILVEVVRIPLRAWLRIADAIGVVVLSVWRRAWPAAVPVARAGRGLLRRAARVATPARAALAVSLVAVGALAASQFVDYRAVEIGAPQYHAVAGVAPPPEVEQATARSAHGPWLLLIAAAALAVIVVSVALGRRRYALLLIPLAAAAVAVAVAVDAPTGLELGQAGVSYQGARATLLDGFGAEVASACVLGLSGVLIAASAPAGPERAGRRGTATAAREPSGAALQGTRPRKASG